MILEKNLHSTHKSLVSESALQQSFGQAVNPKHHCVSGDFELKFRGRLSVAEAGLPEPFRPKWV